MERQWSGVVGLEGRTGHDGHLKEESGGEPKQAGTDAARQPG
ncbi:MAG: hypothetical protein P8Y94_08025 [Acidobacteriota bacterium]